MFEPTAPITREEILHEVNRLLDELEASDDDNGFYKMMMHIGHASSRGQSITLRYGWENMEECSYELGLIFSLDKFHEDW